MLFTALVHPNFILFKTKRCDTQMRNAPHLRDPAFGYLELNGDYCTWLDMYTPLVNIFLIAINYVDITNVVIYLLCHLVVA